MASDGSQGPKPYTQRVARTTFLRVPAADWVAVKRGRKTEFRGSPGNVSGLKFAHVPTPVVAYRFKPRMGYEASLMVLENRWQEELGAITEESLAAEGFADFAEFRRYWVLREKKPFRPTRQVTVFRVRPWRPTDHRAFAYLLMERLYGEWLPETEDPDEAGIEGSEANWLQDETVIGTAEELAAREVPAD